MLNQSNIIKTVPAPHYIGTLGFDVVYGRMSGKAVLDGGIVVLYPIELNIQEIAELYIIIQNYIQRYIIIYKHTKLDED